MNNGTLLLIAAVEDRDYLDAFAKLESLRGWNVKVFCGSVSTAADAQLVARKVGAEAVICCQQAALQVILEAQYDYNVPTTRKQITLDDYAGSILMLPPLPGVAEEKEVVIVNPPKQLRTVSSAKFVFNRFISKLTDKKKWFPQTEFKWHSLHPETHPVEMEEAFSRFAKADLIAVDIETIVGDEERRIATVGFCAYWKDSHTTESIVIPFDCELSWIWVQKFNELRVPKIFQNGMYDNTYFARWNCLPTNWLWDTQHLFHSWYSELPKRLDFITAFTVRRVRFWKDDGSTGNLADYYRYNALDTWATLNSFLALMNEMPQWALDNYLIEFPLVFPCLHCAWEGVKIDEQRLAEVKKEQEAKAAQELEKIRYLMDTPNFNPNSHIQVKNLFTVLGVGNLPNTGAASMLKARAASPLNDIILGRLVSYKKAAKLLSTYLVPEKLWHGRILFALNPAGTDTGRLASTESAFWCGWQIQNVPRGKLVKQCVIADDGWLLCEIDKAQSEARCVGYLSGEEKLITLVESENDYHSWNASQFFGVPYEKIYDNATHEQKDKVLRDLSKRTNHGANYNMGAGVMLDTMGPKNVIRAKSALKLPAHMRLKDVCQFLLDRYSATYPKVKKLYYGVLVKKITLTKKLVSPLGWTRYFFGDPATNKQDLNAVVAHEPQNLSVGIINKEFYAIWRSSVYGELRGRIRLTAQIHDSIFFKYRVTEPSLPHYIRDTYMNTTVTIVGADDVTRKMYIPSDVSYGKPRWSELK